MKLLLVDDDELYLSGLADFLLTNGIEVAGTAGSALEALNKMTMLHPDTILMDVQMKGCDGIETTRLIKRDFPDTEIVMLSISEADEDLFEAIRAGASGYLLKSMEPKLFLAKIRGVAAGDTPFSPPLAKRLLQEFNKMESERRTGMRSPLRSEEKSPALTERQRAILEMVAKGHTYREIGVALAIQDCTVRYHIKELLAKLHLANRAQLIAYVAARKL